MNRHRQGYITNCPLRNDFLDILSSALSSLKYSEHTSKISEKFLVYTKNNTDSVDLEFNYIYYPLPYVKEIIISDWKGGWETDQSFLHLEYWDYKWKIRKSILKVSDKQGESFKERIKVDSYLEGNDVILEIINYFNEIDPSISKSMIRNYNLSKLV